MSKKALVILLGVTLTVVGIFTVGSVVNSQLESAILAPGAPGDDFFGIEYI